MPGREDEIYVCAVEHSVVSPRDAVSGLPTGKRQHAPIAITKSIDKSTPVLYNALVNNENLTDVTITFYRPSSTGKTQEYFTIRLVNARVSGVESLSSEDSLTLDRETISFTYQKVIWTWDDGGITAEDDWETPVA